MSANPNLPPPGPRQPRVLACVLCQHRKIKCDRNTPCSNCVKANVTCTPSTPAPARKRRRPNQDLQERLARCEALLKQYAGAGPPPAAASASQSPTTPFKDMADSPEPWNSHLSDFEKVPTTGKMIQSESGSRFYESQLWTKFHEELQAMRHIVDTEDPEESSVLGTEGMTPEKNGDLLIPGDRSSQSGEPQHPDPVQTFRLWQIFLDRVNPLTKIIHVPTLQPYIVEATTDPSNVPLHYQALLFAVYLMATLSLSEAECHQLLGSSQALALQRFSSATRTALLRFDYLRNYDMAALQALVLFMIFLQGRYDRHAAWVISGTIVRIAQKMGYHRDGELLKLTPFETEMRRRIWWQILMQDTKLAITSGLSHSSVQDNFDTKQPQNLNDADLYPGSSEPVHSREGPTEMAFILVMNRLSVFMISDSNRAGFESAVLCEGANEDGSASFDPALLEKYRGVARELDADLREIERRYIDESAGAAHAAALNVRSMLVEKLHEMLRPMCEQPEWGTEIFSPKDNLFKTVLINNEHNTEMYERMAGYGFLWFVKMHFQLDVFAVLAGQLCRRPTGALSDRGWTVVEKHYKWLPELFDLSQKAHASQAQFTLKAWKAREKAFAQLGQLLPTPAYIERLRECISTPDRSSTATSATPPASSMQGQQPMGDVDNSFLGGYMDIPAMSWDMWGDSYSTASLGNPNQPLSAAFFGTYGMN
ncbi:putative transcriptional regulatory protein-like protein [Emericellopsis cladophorae]|uniref:Transcriptional regulatory protein-like protein n=1 Tax=Emericellopsis cladophorae TaxID=2686198 RepID=A0A9P9Y8W1_9HYPO|nr:putative transcriptional regulatory protein-like protein [Emericellopsis cladophorae]KAI6784934.1 putative transcriptional regulatory protein-like protein [Emericellopsis cladophorae]